eukprot:1613033-Rhodomonas_salina.1
MSGPRPAPQTRGAGYRHWQVAHSSSSESPTRRRKFSSPRFSLAAKVSSLLEIKRRKLRVPGSDQ